MDVANTSRITRFVPPTISRWPVADEPHPVEPPPPEAARQSAGTPVEPGRSAGNPLAALFQSGARWAFPGPDQRNADDDQPTLGRFVDVIA